MGSKAGKNKQNWIVPVYWNRLACAMSILTLLHHLWNAWRSIQI
jgi:hypothetical protein